MRKLDLFHAAMKSRRYLDIAWITSAFAITRVRAGEGGGVETTRAWDIQSDMSGYRCINQEGEAIPIEDAVVGEPLFHPAEIINVNPGDAPNIREPVQTTYGDLLFNWIVVVDAAGDLVAFEPTGMTVGKFLKKVRPIFTDNPAPGQDRQPGKFYVEDYLRLARNVYNVLAGASQIFTTSMSERHMVVNEEITKYKKQLFKEYEGRLDDPLVVVEIQNKLKAFDEACLSEKYGAGKKDPFLAPRKNATARSKISQMFGVEPHPDGDPTKVYLVKNSLDEGIDIGDLPVMFNTVRSGSYARGHETQLGGVVFKDIVRSTSGLEVDDGFCGTKIGLPTLVTEKNAANFVGLNLLTSDKPLLIGKESDMAAYVGKEVMLALPAYCQAPPYHYCRTCCGEVAWQMRDSTAQAAAAIGHGFMGVFMAAMHGQDFEVEEFNLNDIV